MTDNKPKGLSVDEVMDKAKKAAESFRQLNQEQTDKIVKAVYEAGLRSTAWQQGAKVNGQNG